MKRAVLYSVENARSDRHRLIAKRPPELGRWLRQAFEGIPSEIREHLSDRSYPRVISLRQVNVRPRGAELSVPVTIGLAPAREHQDPELARADQVSGESKERVRFGDSHRPIQHLVGQILELAQDAAANALQDVRQVAPLGVHPMSLRGADDQSWRDVWLRTRAALCPEADPSCKDASRQYYLPSHATGALHQATHHSGAMLDASTLPELPRVPRPPRARRVGVSGDRRRGEAYTATVIANLEGAQPGGRNDALNHAAWTLGRWVAAGADGRQLPFPSH